LHVQHAHHFLSYPEGQSHFRTCIWKIRIIEKCRVVPDLERDAWFTRRRDTAHNAALADAQFVPPRQHPFAALTVCSTQHRIFSILIHQEYADMIETELSADQADEAGKQRLKILIGGCRTRDLRD